MMGPGPGLSVSGDDCVLLVSKLVVRGVSWFKVIT